MGKAVATPQLADAHAYVCRVSVRDPWLKNVETIGSVSAQLWHAAFLSQASFQLNCHETEISGPPQD